jgi:hypothetical protein
MVSYDALKNKKMELIRKATDGSVFVADLSADPIANLTKYTAAVAGPPAVPARVDLEELPDTWDDLGWLTGDGAQFARDVSSAETTSWGSNTPTRTDITSDTTTLTVVAQETKLLTIGLATGADLVNVVPAVNTGEVSIAKPAKPQGRHYRTLSLAVDSNEHGEIYIARFLPRAKVSNYAEQSFGAEGEITWGVTLTGEVDSELGYSERYIFGGAGWKAILTDMGFPAAA